MSQKLPAHVIAENYWGGGPTLDVIVKLETANSLLSMTTNEALLVLSSLRIEGPYGSIKELAHRTAITDDWRTHADARGCVISYGIWRLAEGSTVGVKPGPGIHDDEDFVLAIPPGQIEATFDGYPWVLKGAWVTPDVIRLHAFLIERIRDLHLVFPVKSALVQEESGPYPRRGNWSGILMAQDVARAGGFVGEAAGMVGHFRIELER